jgi:hypothetical protein
MRHKGNQLPEPGLVCIHAQPVRGFYIYIMGFFQQCHVH